MACEDVTNQLSRLSKEGTACKKDTMDNQKKTNEELTSELDQFTGSNQLHRWSQLFRNMVITPGVKYLCDNSGEQGCYWLIDAIASYQPKLLSHQDRRLAYMQIWILSVNLEKRNAVLICVADIGEKPVVIQKFDSTDMQLPTVRLWVVSNEHENIIMLPSEY